MLKTDLLQIHINFFTYYFNRLCPRFLFSHVFTTLEFDCDYVGIFLVKIVKPRDHNEIKSPI